MNVSLLFFPLGLVLRAAPGPERECPSGSEQLVESALSRKGSSPSEAWTLATCFWPELVAAVQESSTDAKVLDPFVAEIVRQHLRRSLASDRPAFPDSLSASRQLFSILLGAEPPQAKSVVNLMVHPILHDQAVQTLRGHVNHPAVIQELAAALADPARRNDAMALLDQVRGAAAAMALAGFMNHPDESVRGEIAWLLGRTGAREALPLAAKALKDGFPIVRYNAIWGLALLPQPQSAYLVRSAMTDPSPIVRRSAVAVAGQLLDRAAVPLLLQLLKDPDARVREQATYSLEFIEDPATTPFLTETLEKDPDPLVRAGAAGSLLHFPRENVIPALEDALRDPDERVRMRAKHVLGALRPNPPPDSTSSAKTDGGRDQNCAQWIRKLGRTNDQEKLAEIDRMASGAGGTRPECLMIAADAGLDPSLATLARAAAAYKGDPTALGSLEADIHDAAYRRALVHYLVSHGKPAFLFTLTAMDSNNGEIERVLGPLLVRTDDPAIIDRLFYALPKPELHQGAYAALARWATHPPRSSSPGGGQEDAGRVAHAFIGALERPEHRAWAVELLTQTRDPAALRELAEALHHPMPEVREAVATALGNVGDPAVARSLAETLNDPVPVVRARAADALGNLMQPSAIGHLAEALQDPDAGVRTRAAWALARTMREGNRAVENPSAIEALRTALTDPGPTVRDAAAGAFMILKIPHVVPDLGKLLKDSDANVRLAAVWALAELRTPEATDAILSALSHPDAGLRLRAVQVLHDRMDKTIRAKLEKMKKSDPSPLVRQAAAEALQ